MLEEALKRDPSGHARDVGWRRSSARETDSRRASEERQSSLPTPTIAPAPASAFGVTHGLDSAGGRNSPAVPPTPATAEERRFFKFRFTTGSSSAGARPATPNGTAIATGLYHHLNSPSLPSLPAHAKELEELNEQLQKERAAKKKVGDEKAALEAELESLSQALFEEVGSNFSLILAMRWSCSCSLLQANKMVATERIKRAETEDELKEARLEKEALRSALRLLEDQHSSETSSPMMPFTSSPSPSSSSAPAASAPILSMSAPMSHSRTSSEIAIKSAPISPSSSRPLTRSPSPAPSPSTLPSPLPSSTSQTHSPPTIPDITPQRLRPPPLPLDEPVSARGKYDREHEHELEVDVQLEDEVTPQIRRSRPPSLHLHDYNPAFELSPWADAPSQSQAHAHSRRTPGMGIFSGATV